jgi:uncharacterized protein (UPF0332 family)
MKKSLIKLLKKQEKIKLVESSLEVSQSYLIKAQDCLKSGKLLSKNNLFENSIFMLYYAMYDSLLSLLFRIGIKSENHSFSIFLLDNLFMRKDLSDILSFAKKERIDKQYYVNDKIVLNRSVCEDLFFKAEDFLNEIKLILEGLNLNEIEKFRNNFLELIK